MPYNQDYFAIKETLLKVFFNQVKTRGFQALQGQNQLKKISPIHANLFISYMHIKPMLETIKQDSKNYLDKYNNKNTTPLELRLLNIIKLLLLQDEVITLPLHKDTVLPLILQSDGVFEYKDEQESDKVSVGFEFKYIKNKNEAQKCLQELISQELINQLAVLKLDARFSNFQQHIEILIKCLSAISSPSNIDEYRHIVLFGDSFQEDGMFKKVYKKNNRNYLTAVDDNFRETPIALLDRHAFKFNSQQELNVSELIKWYTKSIIVSGKYQQKSPPECLNEFNEQTSGERTTNSNFRKKLYSTIRESSESIVAGQQDFAKIVDDERKFLQDRNIGSTEIAVPKDSHGNSHASAFVNRFGAAKQMAENVGKTFGQREKNPDKKTIKDDGKLVDLMDELLDDIPLPAANEPTSSSGLIQKQKAGHNPETESTGGESESNKPRIRKRNKVKKDDLTVDSATGQVTDKTKLPLIPANKKRPFNLQ